MYGLLNTASLLLGLAAWALPIASLIRRKKPQTALSAACCSLSLLCQILYTQHLVSIRDWSAIEDTHGAVTLAAAVLVCVTAILNAPSLLKDRR